MAVCFCGFEQFVVCGTQGFAVQYCSSSPAETRRCPASLLGHQTLCRCTAETHQVNIYSLKYI